MKSVSSLRDPRGAFALVIVLIFLCLLTVVAVDFLSSVTTERASVNANVNKTSAELAAQSGVDNAVAELRAAFQAYPDSATVWDGAQSANDDGTFNEGTTLYLRAASRTDGSGNTVPDPNGANAPTAQPDSRRTFVLPLVSGVPNGNARLLSQRAGVLPVMRAAETDASKPLAFEQTYTDLNVRRFSGDTQGAIGSPPTWSDTVPKPARAFWVETTSDVRHTPGNTADDPVTSRYAFWIEDESFRANVDYAKVPPTGDNRDNTAQYTDGGTARSMQPSDANLLGVLAAIPPGPGTQPLATTDSIAAASGAAVVQTRSQYPGAIFLEPVGYQHGFGTAFTYPNYPDVGGDAQKTRARYLDQLRYLTTTTSSSLNLTRHGTQRLNFNDTVTLGGASIPDARGKLQRQIDQIVGFMAFHAPDFGQRFYRTNTDTTSARMNSAQDVIAAHAPIYFYKIAANLHDFIDPDAQPTLIQAGGQVLPLAVPSPLAPYVSGDGPNPLWAMGKDSAPFLEEAVIRFRPLFSKANGTYDLKIDYYIEFWNMTDKDVYAGNVPAGATGISLGGAMLHISNQESWVDKAKGSPLTVSDGGSSPVLGDNDYDIDLSDGVQLGGSTGAAQPSGVGVVFRAGTATVITTDPDCATFKVLGYQSEANPTRSLTGKPNPATTFYCSRLVGRGRREYSGPVTTTGTSYGIYPVIQPEGGQTELTLYNSKGYLEFSAFALPEGKAIVTNTDTGASTQGSANDYVFGSSLIGNQQSASELCDPRTNNEQINIRRFISDLIVTSSEPDQTRFFNVSHSLGYPDGNRLQLGPTAIATAIPWPDYFSMPTASKYANCDQTNAPMVVADGPLTSIGQLGDVFDPARLPGAVGSLGIGGSRGGGRTIRLGQPDDRYNCDPTGNDGTGSNSPMNTTDNIPASTSWAAWRLADLFSIDNNMERPARVNINGVGRDGGAALRTLLTGYASQPVTGTDPGIHGDMTLAGQALVSDLSRTALNRANPGFKGPGDQASAPNLPYGVQRLVGAMLNRLNPASTAVLPRPFFERGELGELGTVTNGQVTNSVLGVNGATTTATNTDLYQGANMNVSFDHGREELFRRVAEQICTRGDVFTVYAVGQSIAQNPPNLSGATALEKNPPRRVLATQRLRVTFRLRPKDAGGKDFAPGYTQNGATLAYTDFVPATNPLSPDSNNPRYAKPARFDVEVLHVSNF